MEHKGYNFCCKRKVEETHTSYWVCAQFRGGCKARLIIRNGTVKSCNGHTCREVALPKLTDVRSEMRAALQAACLSNLSTPPGMIWERIMSSLREAYPNATLSTIGRTPGISIIKYTRAQVTGSDTLRAIELAPMRNVAEDDVRPFLQFSVVHTMGCAQHRCLGFGHPDLIRLLRYSGTTLFIDCTFKMVPKPFYQCLIVMVRDPDVDLYVPAMYVLMDSKQQDVYWNVLNYIVIQTGRLLEPSSVTCDFERALMNAVTEQFPLVKIVGCLFHWKQALRRKMLEKRIPLDQISAALAPDVLDVLTLIPVDEIPDKVFRMDETGSKTKLDAYWRYFKNLTNRTNNPLERYNRAFGERFSVAHPSLLSFIEKAKFDSRRYVQMIEDIKHTVVILQNMHRM
ncbi:Hypothetical protein PHPALM_14436 [Phytophthora palmivora]|uniref:MULE transposase domain-containing protein n=1 Tax=Phytophthora palmivora TaxID=4796 RepID=A0A2P4XUY4_9STRA|nr:Hypothetical protein PHPALM_14436 [Phytophthora palmivora]